MIINGASTQSFSVCVCVCAKHRIFYLLSSLWNFIDSRALPRQRWVINYPCKRSSSSSKIINREKKSVPTQAAAAAAAKNDPQKKLIPFFLQTRPDQPKQHCSKWQGLTAALAFFSRCLITTQRKLAKVSEREHTYTKKSPKHTKEKRRKQQQKLKGQQKCFCLLLILPI